jgi:WD40 repeat protein
MGHDAAISACAFAPDGEQLATASYDGSLILWDLQHREMIDQYDIGWPVWTVAWAPDGRSLAVGDEVGIVHLLRLERPKHRVVPPREAVAEAKCLGRREADSAA